MVVRRIVEARWSGDAAAAVCVLVLAADYLVLDVVCAGSDDGVITGVYEQSSSPREEVTVPCSIGPKHWTVFWAVYQYPALASFQWFEWSKEAPVRINAIRRMKDPASTPVLLKAAVPDDFRDRAYHTLLPGFYSDSRGAGLYLAP